MHVASIIYIQNSKPIGNVFTKSRSVLTLPDEPNKLTNQSRFASFKIT